MGQVKSAEEGTGIVHIAPGCGAEDFELAGEHNLPLSSPRWTRTAILWEASTGSLVNRSRRDRRRFRRIGQHRRFYRKQRYATAIPLLALRQRAGLSSGGRMVHQHGRTYDKPRRTKTPEEKGGQPPLPDHGFSRASQLVSEFRREREMDWLRNMHGLMISSKKRYYGLALPLPIWECADCGHFTSSAAEELEERAVEGWDGLTATPAPAVY